MSSKAGAACTLQHRPVLAVGVDTQDETCLVAMVFLERQQPIAAVLVPVAMLVYFDGKRKGGEQKEHVVPEPRASAWDRAIGKDQVLLQGRKQQQDGGQHPYFLAGPESGVQVGVEAYKTVQA
jgi:hypothetical protein